MKKLQKRIVAGVYALLNAAKLTGMEAKDKFCVVKMVLAMKPVAKGYEDYITDVREKLKPDDWQVKSEAVQRWQAEGEKCGLSIQERKELNEYFERYSQEVNDCVRQEADSEVELPFEPVGEEAFGKLLSANEDWTVEQIAMLQEVIGV